MKKIVIIPARYASTRFPGKPLADLLGKPMIQHVCKGAAETPSIDSVYVATDDKRIYTAVKSFGGMPLMTSIEHTCGTERLAECAIFLKLDDKDIVLNIQGDEPMISPVMVEDLLGTFDDSNVYMGTLKRKITISSDVENINVVKVITNLNNDAIYFSRHPIPYDRSGILMNRYRHIGVYGYKVWFLKRYAQMMKSTLEISESLEQLRVIENGYKIRVLETNCMTISVDTPEELKEVESLMQEGKYVHE